MISCVTRICILKRQKETLQGLRKNMQSKMIFKDHIDRLSTDVRPNNNYDMVCGIIFFQRFCISDLLIQYNMTRFQINFVLLANARNIIRVASPKVFTYNLRLRKFHSQGDVASLS